MKRLLFPALAVLSSLAAAAVLTEILLRGFYPQVRDRVLPPGLIQMDEDLGWHLAPGVSTWHHTGSFQVSYNINARGFRDRSRGQEKPEGFRRCLLFGDSLVFGWGVPEAARFSNIVESRSPGIEIWNLGVPAYGLDQQVLAYELNFTETNADEALFFVSYYTTFRTRYDYIYTKYKPKFELSDDGELHLVSRPGHRASMLGAMYALLGSFYLPYFIGDSVRDLLWPPFRGSSACDGCLGKLETALLLRAARIAASRHQKMSAIIIAPAGGLTSTAACANPEIRCIPVALDPRKGDQFGPNDVHWTPQAHRRFAEQLLTQLQVR